MLMPAQVMAQLTLLSRKTSLGMQLGYQGVLDTSSLMQQEHQVG